MRFLILTAVLACASAMPSGLIGYGAQWGAPLITKVPTINSGDLQAAAIDAHVEASDHVRASVDATRQLHDRVSEIQGQALNAAEDHAWASIDATKTVEAQLDGAAAGVSPILAKQLVGHAAPLVHAAHLAHAAPLAHALPLGHATPLAYAGSQSISTSSISQTHPAPVYHHSAPLAYSGLHAW